MHSGVSTRAVSSLWLVALLAAATLAAVWYAQLGLGYLPCKLCYQERLPYYVGLPLALAAVVVAGIGWGRATFRTLAVTVAVAFAIGIALGVYHAGVEWRWWLGPADCGAAGNAMPAQASDLLGALKTVRVVSCTEAAARFLGLSFAGWNAVLCAVLLLLSIRAIFDAEKV